MATSSFNKNFVVTDQECIKQLRISLNQPRRVEIKKRDYEADKIKGLALLKQQLLNEV